MPRTDNVNKFSTNFHGDGHCWSWLLHDIKEINENQTHLKIWQLSLQLDELFFEKAHNFEMFRFFSRCLRVSNNASEKVHYTYIQNT